MRGLRSIPIPRRLLQPVILWTGLILSGCGAENRPRLYPVAGYVLLAGVPLAGGSVTLRPDSTHGGWEQPTGSIEADGRYQVYTQGRSGAPAGRYVVVVFSTTSKPGDQHYGLGYAWARSVEACAVANFPIDARRPNGAPYASGDWQGQNGFHSRHVGGAHFALADGSARFHSENMALGLYRALATLRGGEALGDW